MANKKFNTVVIGAGPGGYVAAIRLAQLGISTAIIEKEYFGGVCLNVGCIPSKALIRASSVYETISHGNQFGFKVKGGVEIDFAALQGWKSDVVKKLTGGIGQLLKGNGVEVIKGDAAFTGPKQIEVTSVSGKEKIDADNFIIAVGSTPIEIPSFRFDEKNILSSTGALAIDKEVKSLIVIGGGYIGLEIGTYLAKLGTKVTILEAESRLLPSYDEDVADVVIRSLKKRGVNVITGAMAKSFIDKNGEREVTLEVAGEKRTLSAEKVLVTVGRRPNPMAGIEKTGVKVDRGFIPVDAQRRTNIAHIFAIGDVAGQPMLAHKASKEGIVAAEVIAKVPGAAFDVKAMPAVIFCEPELATVGMSENEARKAGIDVMVGAFPFAALGKSIAAQETEGFAKIIGDKKTGRFLGAAIVGHESSALIAECALALEAGLQVEDIALTVHAHPTLAEATMEAAEVALGHPIHIMAKRPRK
jgi:dihydrolipoamide dehydrogenase